MNVNEWIIYAHTQKKCEYSMMYWMERWFELVVILHSCLCLFIFFSDLNYIIMKHYTQTYTRAPRLSTTAYQDIPISYPKTTTVQFYIKPTESNQQFLKFLFLTMFHFQC